MLAPICIQEPLKRLSSTPALYQRQGKAPKHYSTIFKHLCICSCFHFYFPVFVVSQLSLTNTVLHQRVRHCWQGNIMPCEMEGVFIKINNLGMQVMWYHHLYLSIWKQHFKPWFPTQSALPSPHFPESNVQSLWITHRGSFIHNMRQKNQSIFLIFSFVFN